MLKYVRSLKFEETPNYAGLHKLLNDVAVKKGFKFDNIFDWNDTVRHPSKLPKEIKKVPIKEGAVAEMNKIEEEKKPLEEIKEPRLVDPLIRPLQNSVAVVPSAKMEGKIENT